MHTRLPIHRKGCEPLEHTKIVLAAAHHAPAQEAPDTPAQHQGMTIAGNGAAELGKLMREQRDSRMDIYPDGNPNSGQP